MVFTLVVTLQANSPASAEKLSAKLVEAAASYRKDVGTIDWIVSQDAKDKTKFCIIERYTSSKALKAHTANPTYAAFGPFVKPLLASAFVINMYNELDDAPAKL